MTFPYRESLRLPATEPDRGQGASGTSSGSLAGRRILIVDDNNDAADSLSMLLEYLGATARVANSGEAALGMLEEYQPEFVLLDIGMPDMDGYTVARRVRAQPRFASAKLIALSGWGQDEDKQRSSDSGIDYHLTKPVDLSTLEALLLANL